MKNDIKNSRINFNRKIVYVFFGGMGQSSSGGVTTLVIRTDGTFYDLWYALKDTGNY